MQKSKGVLAGFLDTLRGVPLSCLLVCCVVVRPSLPYQWSRILGGPSLACAEKQGSPKLGLRLSLVLWGDNGARTPVLRTLKMLSLYILGCISECLIVFVCDRHSVPFNYQHQ